MGTQQSDKGLCIFEQTADESGQKDLLPSSIFSFAKDCPLRTAIERNVIEFNLEPPRYLVELVVPLLAAPAPLAFVLAPVSPASLLLLRGPESENNLPEI